MDSLGLPRVLATLAMLLVVVLVPGAVAHAAGDDEPEVTVHYFYGEECPYCQMLGPRLAALAEDHPRVRVEAYEVWHDSRNQERFAEMAAAHGVAPSGVPMTFAAGRMWTGFSEELWADMEAAILAAAEPVAKAEPTDAPAGTVLLPLLGEVGLADASLLGTTALIAFVDGFNPCSLWVLSVLLAMTLHARSRRRLLLVGGTFLTVTAVVYGLFITGLFNVLSYVAYVGWIQVVVALVALTFAVVAIKDFFWFKRGLSFTIPDRFKPRIYRGSRRLATGDHTTAALVGGTAVLALGVALVELPCTAGFPVIWTNALAAQAVETPAFLGLLAVYLGVYLLDEAALFAVVVVTLRIGRFGERHGRLLKLLGGTVMLALAGVLLADPTRLADLTGTLVVFAAALGLAAVIAVVDRVVRGPASALAQEDTATRPGTGSGLPSAAARRPPAARSRASSRR